MIKQKITKIAAQKRADRVNIYLDGSFSFGMKATLLADYRLAVGDELTQQRIDEITTADDLALCLDKAYQLLSYRPRSESEIRTRLLTRFSPETTEKAIKKLLKLRYIGDLEFARWWVEARGESRGPALLVTELRQKGIGQNTITEVISRDEEAQLKNALALATSKRRFEALDKDALYKKLGPYLARRGYSYSIAKKVIAKFLEERR